MRTLALVLSVALLSAGLTLAAPTASATPCNTPNECIDRVLATLGCPAMGGDPTDPLNWNFGAVIDCVLENTT
jgi:hypothetical protein